MKNQLEYTYPVPIYLINQIKVENIDFTEMDRQFPTTEGMFKLNPTTPLDHQVKTLFYQLLHMDQEYIRYTGEVCAKTITKNPNLEQQIYKKAITIYENRPDITNIAKREIELAQLIYNKKVHRIKTKTLKQMQRLFHIHPSSPQTIN